ncbi:chemotaxis protein methyltransferase CheR [Chitinivorax tropicus]|uniref:Chemotaxis protein methyltransferase n=1 Tax=Chitinivorax tropicus TaxID=714531 RepID=A0A840MSG9_9PROT|nr:CheR family methyltransferase [Chitinivorax tropicus]MBB5019356.1 chemotaxis protein methyltransferase CheR [Chitinivorax tropicus]
MSDVKEFVYTQRDFERARSMIYARAGIKLEPSKYDMVYSRLSRRLRVLHMKRFQDYLDSLEGQETDEWQAFINALTTNLTSFFREAHHFSMLAEYFEAHQQHAGKFRVWSAACSTGEEPYSIAMVAVEHFGTWSPPVEVIATDLDTHCLETARRGVYPVQRVERLSNTRLKHFFLKGNGQNEGQVRVRQDLRRLIEFRQLNLLDAAYDVEGRFDVIFCRNVMIYFDKPTQKSIVEKLAARLQPDGVYFAGHSESLHHVVDYLKLIGNTAYVHANNAQTTLKRGHR